MAKRANTGNITKTTTTKSTKEPATIKTGNGKVIAGIVVLLPLLSVAAYFLMNPTIALAQQRIQFANQLSKIQNNNQNLTLYYLANAPNYLSLNQSWSVQVTDQSPANSIPIGQLTVSWSGQSKSLSVQNGIVNTGISPTYALTLSHSDFMSFSRTVIARNTAAALFYYSVYYLSGKLKYTRVS